MSTLTQPLLSFVVVCFVIHPHLLCNGRVCTTAGSRFLPLLSNQHPSLLCPNFLHTRHLRLFVADPLFAPGLPFAIAFSSPDLCRSPFLGRPDFFAAVQSGHKRKVKSGSHPSFTDLMVMFASAYTSNGNCSLHCLRFHHIGITFIGVIWGRITAESAIVAMCLHGTTSVRSAPQVHLPKYDPLMGFFGSFTICSCLPATFCQNTLNCQWPSLSRK